MIHTRHFTSSLVIRDNGDGRPLVGPLLPWGVRARVVDRGRLVTETFERLGAPEHARREALLHEHAAGRPRRGLANPLHAANAAVHSSAAWW